MEKKSLWSNFFNYILDAVDKIINLLKVIYEFSKILKYHIYFRDHILIFLEFLHSNLRNMFYIVLLQQMKVQYKIFTITCVI